MVVIDELGRGTSTYDGFGLAWAIAEYVEVIWKRELKSHACVYPTMLIYELVSKVYFRDLISRVKCFCMFATHFHEMAELRTYYPEAVRNVCTTIQFDENGELVLLYKIKDGVAVDSFGLNIAKLVGLPDTVVEVSFSSSFFLLQN